MAEIDMEIDTHPPHVDMEHADEDLIDYEEDFPHQEEQPLETGLGEDQEQPDVAADKEEDNDGGFDTTLGGSADIQEHQESLDSLQESTTGGEADGDVSVELMADDAAEEHQGVQDGGEVDNQGEEPSAPQTNDQDYINDLDFGYEDGQGQGAANVEDAAPNDESQDAESTIVGKQTVETDQDAETHAEISETETKAEEGTAEQRVAHDEDEITWEEGNAEHPQEPGTSETVQGQEGKEAGQNEEREDNTAQDNQEPEDLGSEQHQQTQATEAEAEHSSHADVEVDADATTEANIDAGETKEPNDPEFPLITVQYNGEEFPLISHSSEGFFDNTSILDESIESLLAGFRAELADEVGPEEELVFQVDEAGLEYSEVSLLPLSHSTLCNIDTNDCAVSLSRGLVPSHPHPDSRGFRPAR